MFSLPDLIPMTDDTILNQFSALDQDRPDVAAIPSGGYAFVLTLSVQVFCVFFFLTCMFLQIYSHLSHRG